MDPSDSLGKSVKLQRREVDGMLHFIQRHGEEKNGSIWQHEAMGSEVERELL